MPGENPPPRRVPGEATPTPSFASLGLRTPSGWVPLPSEQPLPPPAIPDYTVLRRIGGGAYGEVWLARNLTGSHFAIKVVHRCLFDHDRPYERELAGIRRFEPISRSHPSQVAIHHVGQNAAEGYFYYVMDLADDAAGQSPESAVPGPRSPVQGPKSQVEVTTTGLRNPASGIRHPACAPRDPKPEIRDPGGYVPKTLKHLLRTRGRLPGAECVDIALALATALEHLHGHGLIHRDIKPSNVIFVGGIPKLADIGLVSSVDATRSFVGTEGFFPPEGPGTPQADLFSLGRLLYEIATGKDRREFPELPTDLPSPEEQEALSELNAVILKACQPDPAQRYATAAALRADLERLLHGRSIKRQRAWQRRWGRARKLALPLVLGSVAVIAIVAWLRHDHESRSAPADDPVPGALNPRAVFVLPVRTAETNGAPDDLCARITDALIDSLGFLTNEGIMVGPRKSGWGHLDPAVQFERVTNQFRMRHALTGRVAISTNLPPGGARLRRALTFPGGSAEALPPQGSSPGSILGSNRMRSVKLPDAHAAGSPGPPSTAAAASVSPLAPAAGETAGAWDKSAAANVDPSGEPDAQGQFELTLTLHDLGRSRALWTGTFRGGTDEVIELERQALAQTAARLGYPFKADQLGQVSQLLTKNLAALDLYRRALGIYSAKGFTQTACNETMRFCQQALRHDPGYLDAQFTDAYMRRNLAMERHPADTWQDVVNRVTAILSKDDTHAAALDQLGGYELTCNRDWGAFHAHYARCFAATPDALRPASRAFYLRICGHFAEARTEQARFETGGLTNSDSFLFNIGARWADRQHPANLIEIRRALQVYPQNVDFWIYLAHSLVALGEFDEGIAVIHRAQALYRRQELTALLGCAYARRGQTAEAREVLQELLKFDATNQYTHPYFTARVYAALGERQQALDWLEKAAEVRSEYLFMPDWGGLRTDPAWDTLQDEPRYWQMCDRLGLGKDQWPRRDIAP